MIDNYRYKGSDIMKCKHCDEEMEESEYVDLGYGNKYIEYNCPNNCEFIKWLNEQAIKKTKRERIKRKF